MEPIPPVHPFNLTLLKSALQYELAAEEMLYALKNVIDWCTARARCDYLIGKCLRRPIERK